MDQTSRTGDGQSARAAPGNSDGRVVKRLDDLLTLGCRYRTIYADPPWDYQNRASRGAARRHYPTMTLAEICAEPVAQLAADDAHLHLWTTNGFLEEAFAVMAAWGFRYKSCFVWVKPQMGAGNYWRVSHEFLLFGVRGCLPFADHCQRSWLEAPRTAHSCKPDRIRWLVEQVSPPPYLELYGRQSRPNSAWTVYGNRVDRLLF